MADTRERTKIRFKIAFRQNKKMASAAGLFPEGILAVAKNIEVEHPWLRIRH